ncbi:PAS domain-containing protein [Clostridioides sp. ES-S-0077-01]|uniref:sensor domain-containing diguanylate cyclase n=1 Tax=Clostridioides sp. ES-S-0077-01 TaxID=2770782 RepID=UPI001D0F53A8|nr:PAS domain-containing protein [Clostridioides sp. ES-S-0077-01]
MIRAKSLKNVLSIVLIFLFTIISFSDFAFKTNVQEEENNKVNLKKISLQSSNAIKIKLDSSLSFIKNVANMVSYFDTIDNSEIIPLLASISKESDFQRISIVSPDGTSHTSDGKIIDVSNYQYFKKAISGESNISEAVKSPIDKKDTFAVATPIFNKNNKVIGILYGSYYKDKLAEFIDITSFNSEGYIDIFESSGKFVLKSSHTNKLIKSSSNNIYEILKKASFDDGYSYKKIYEDIKNNKSGFVSYEYKGENGYATYTPIDINDWYVLSVIPQHTVRKNIDKINQLAFSLIFKVFLLFIILIIYIFYKNNKSQRHILKANKEISSITNSIPGGVQKCTLGETCEFNFLSDGFIDLFGYTREEIKTLFNNNFYSLIHKDDVKRIKREISEQVYKNKTIELEYRVITKSGDTVWVLDKGELITEPDGKEYFCCVTVDITRTKKLEKEMKQKNLELEMVSENILGGILITEFNEDFTIKYTNSGYLSMIGYTREQLEDELQSKACNLIFYDDRKKALENIQHQLNTKGIAVYEHRIRRRDGNIIWVSIKGRLIIDDDGIKKGIWIITDITDLKNAEQKLKINEERFRIALKQTSNTIFEYDIKTKSLLNTSKELDKYNIYKIVENVPYSLVESGVIHKDFSDDFINMYENVINGAKTASCVVKIKLPDGSYIWNKITLTTIFDEDGNPVRAIGIQEDISKQKEAEIKYNEEGKYHSAILSEAMITYEINVSKDTFIKGNESWHKPFGIKPDNNYSEMVKTIANSIIHKDNKEVFLNTFLCKNLLAAYKNNVTEIKLEYRRMNQENKMIWVVCTMHLIKDSITNDIKALAYVKDIDNQKKEEIRLKLKAERDTLTGLYNKGTTEKLINDFLDSEEASSGIHAFLIVDIDNFKSVNDNLGHVFGDKVLFEVSKHLKPIFRKDDIVGRIGGDEFIVFLKNIQSFENAKKKAEKICDIFRNSYTENKKTYKISGTVGISFVPEHGTIFKELYRKADVALYYAKSKGKDKYALYNDYIYQNELKNNISDNNIKELNEYEKSKPILKEVIDSIDNYMYIVNPNTYELIIVNNKIENLDLGIKSGETCYKALLKSDSPCNNCPIKGLKENRHSKFKTETNTFGTNISIASWINWMEGEYNCLIECIDISLYKK